MVVEVDVVEEVEDVVVDVYDTWVVTVDCVDVVVDEDVDVVDVDSVVGVGSTTYVLGAVLPE